MIVVIRVRVRIRQLGLSVWATIRFVRSVRLNPRCVGQDVGDNDFRAG